MLFRHLNMIWRSSRAEKNAKLCLKICSQMTAVTIPVKMIKFI